MIGKNWLIITLSLILVILSFGSFLFIQSNHENSNKSGEVGLPTERMGLPVVYGCEAYGNGYWIGVYGFEATYGSSNGYWLSINPYDCSGVYFFQVPEWGKWYWIGLWDDVNKKYLFGKWIGHFLTS